MTSELKREGDLLFEAGTAGSKRHGPAEPSMASRRSLSTKDSYDSAELNSTTAYCYFR